jgi:hypothetical protein
MKTYFLAASVALNVALGFMCIKSQYPVVSYEAAKTKSEVSQTVETGKGSLREERSDATKLTDGLTATPSRVDNRESARSVLLAREALQYLRYDAFNTDLTLTSAFQLVSGASKEEMLVLTATTGSLAAAIKELENSRTALKQNSPDSAVVFVSSYKEEARSAISSKIDSLKEKVDGDVLDVYRSAVTEQLGRFLNDFGNYDTQYEIKRTLSNGVPIYNVSKSAYRPGSVDSKVFHINQYTRAELLRSVPGLTYSQLIQ